MITKLVQDTSFKGIKSEYTKLSTQYKAPSSKQIGFMQPSYEKALKRSVNYLRKKSSTFGNLNSLKELAFKSGGDFSKLDPKIKKTLDMNYKLCKDWMTEFKSDNITEGSVLRMYTDAYELLSNPKNKAAFAKAVDYEKKVQTGGAIKSNLVVLASIVYILYVLLIFFLIIACFAILIDAMSLTVRAKEAKTLDQKMFETIIESLTANNRAMMLQLGFTVINGIFYLNSFSNLSKAIDDGFKNEKEAMAKYKKGKEDGYIDYYGIKDTGVSLVNNSGMTQSNESAVLIIALSIMGVVLVVSLVRRSIYWIGALKVDIIKLLMIEAETLNINIQELEAKRDKTTNPAEKKKLDSIINKQKAVYEKLKSKIDSAVNDSNVAYHESEDQVNSEDRENEQNPTVDDDYDIIL